MFQGKLIEELTEIVESAEQHAHREMELSRTMVARGIALVEPQDTDRDTFLLGAA